MIFAVSQDVSQDMRRRFAIDCKTCPGGASGHSVRAAIGKDGNRLVFGHKKPPAGDRGGRALVRPGLLPIGRIPFREPPCAGTQVGEGIALLLMQFTDYRSFFWPS